MGDLTPFADRLAALVEERRSQICLGLDPDPGKLTAEPPAEMREGASAAEYAAAAVSAHCRALIAEAGPACVAVKPQLACFERLGAPGWAALVEVCEAAGEAGLLTIADGKRGDVPVSAAAYAQALVGETPTPWGPVAGLGVDAFTVNPLLGADALEPFVQAAEASGAGVFALVRTSNPGAADLEDLETAMKPDAPGSLHEHVAALVDSFAPRLMGSAGLSGMGAVVGATRPEHIIRLRELMPHAVFLMPGVGAQGGRPEDLGAAFAGTAAAGLVTASRGIAGDPDPAAAAERLRATVWGISTT